MQYEPPAKDVVWHHITKRMKAGIGTIYVPVGALPFCLMAIFSKWFLIPAVYLVLTHIIQVKNGMRKVDYMRFIRSQVNLGRLHAHPIGRKRSSFYSAILGAATLFLVTPHSADASFQLIMPVKEKASVIEVETQGLNYVPVLAPGIIKQGFGIDVKLQDVLSQLLPATWAMDFRDPELSLLPVSWRSQNSDVLEIMQDLADRYSVLFRYSNKTGVVHIEWTTDGCTTGPDDANVYRIIC